MMAALIISIQVASAQYINNKLNIYAGVRKLTVPNLSTSIQGDFRMPAFYYTMQPGFSHSVRATYHLTDFLRAGIGYEQSEFSNQHDKDHSIYSGAQAKAKYWGAIVMVHKKASSVGHLSKVRFTAQVNPQVGFHWASVRSTPYSAYMLTGGREVALPATEQYTGAGGNVSVGLEYTCFNIMGLYANYGYSYHRTKSTLHADPSLRYQFVEAGLYLRLLNNKRYFY